VQNRLKKLSLHAGHDDIMLLAVLRFDSSASIYVATVNIGPCCNARKLACSPVQHTGPVLHFVPQRSTNCFRTSSAGSSAGPLSGHGSGFPKRDFPQFPRIEHLPASCIGVYGSHIVSITQRRVMAVMSCHELRMTAVSETADQRLCTGFKSGFPV
jgi:hypothetical protein